MGAKRLIALTLLFGALSGFAKTNPGNLSVTANSAVIIDANSGAVLWSKNPELRSFPASTTKIMTALLLLKSRSLSDTMTAPNGIEKVPPSSMHLKSGEQISVHDLLYALMLRSANDAAVTIAYDLAGSREKFAEMMNQEAVSLGCTHTHFNNPNGLDDPDHWTTAADMAKIARAAMQIPFFRDVVKTQRYKVTRSINQQDVLMTNRDKILRHDPTQDGIKTGWTVPAGHCFVGSASRNGFRVIAVEFHSQNWAQDNQNMMDWAFGTFKHVEVEPAGSQLGIANLNDSAHTKLPVGINEPLEAIEADSAMKGAFKVTFVVNLPVTRTIQKGDQVGTAIAWNQAGEQVGVAPLVAMEAYSGNGLEHQSEKSGFQFRYPLIVAAFCSIIGIVITRKGLLKGLRVRI